MGKMYKKVRKKNLTLKKVLLIVAAVGLLSNNSSKAQIGINTTGNNPHTSAALDVDYPNKGLLIPRVALSSNTDVTTIPSPANSLVVYNTNAGMTNGNGVGFYYWDAGAGKWMYMATAQNGPGSAGQVLTSTGPGSNPQWTTLSVSGGCSGSVQMISNVSTTTMNWRACANYCATLTEGGYDDWRMPTIEDVVFYMSSWDKVKNSSGTFLTTQPSFTSYIWIGELAHAGTTTYSSWIIFNESTGSWHWNDYYNSDACRCVR